MALKPFLKIRTAVVGWLGGTMHTDIGPRPVIMTQFGPVSEQARLQCAINMLHDPELKERIISHLAMSLKLPRTLAVDEAKRRFPEAWA